MQGITADAASRLKSSLEQAEADDDLCIRLQFDGSGAQLTLDHKDQNDQVFEVEGRPILVVDQAAARKSEGKTLDFRREQFCFV